MLSKVILLCYLICLVFEQITNVVAMKTKEVNGIQLAGNETELSNNYKELLHQRPGFIPEWHRS